MTARPMASPEAFHQGVDCQAENEWCNYPEPHEHGGFACEESCLCRDAEMASRLGYHPQGYGWQK